MVDYPSNAINWGAITDKPELPEGISQGEYASAINGIKAETAQLMLKNSLTDWNYDDGFIDTFWDSSKVASSSNVNIATGENAEISLSTEYGSTVSDTAANAFSNSSRNGVAINPNTTIQGVSVSLFGGTTATKAYLIDSTGNVLTSKDISGQSSFEISYEMQSGTKYAVAVDDAGASYTSEYGDATFPVNSQDLDAVDRYSDGYDNASSQFYAIGDIQAILGPYQSGSITHTRKQLTDEQGNPITPTSIVATPEYDSSGTGESVELVVSDNSGNSTTISESQFGTEVSVSFQDGNIQGQPKLYSDGSSSPKWEQTEFLGVDN